MARISVPTPRKHGLIGAVLAVWTAPTTLLGHVFAWLLGSRNPERIEGRAARAWLYRLPVGRLEYFGAIAVGHVIIVAPRFLDKHGPWLLAHELSHTRQHDWLGPVYLPVHIILLTMSALIYTARPIAKLSPWHSYNPLERVLICVPIDVIFDESPPKGELAEKVLCEFGLIDQGTTDGIDPFSSGSPAPSPALDR